MMFCAVLCYAVVYYISVLCYAMLECYDVRRPSSQILAERNLWVEVSQKYFFFLNYIVYITLQYNNVVKYIGLARR